MWNLTIIEIIFFTLLSLCFVVGVAMLIYKLLKAIMHYFFNRKRKIEAISKSNFYRNHQWVYIPKLDDYYVVESNQSSAKTNQLAINSGLLDNFYTGYWTHYIDKKEVRKLEEEKPELVEIKRVLFYAVVFINLLINAFKIIHIGLVLFLAVSRSPKVIRKIKLLYKLKIHKPIDFSGSKIQKQFEKLKLAYESNQEYCFTISNITPSPLSLNPMAQTFQKLLFRKPKRQKNYRNEYTII